MEPCSRNTSAGYNFKGQLLRPAMVKVAVAPAAKD